MVDDHAARSERILYVAHHACGNPALCREVRAHAAPDADMLVVAPVLPLPPHMWTTDDDEDRACAERRLDESIRCLRGLGFSAHGRLGDADPVQAVADALIGFPADEIVVCLERPERSHWLRRGVVERARNRFQIPVREIDVAPREAAVA